MINSVFSFHDKKYRLSGRYGFFFLFRFYSDLSLSSIDTRHETCAPTRVRTASSFPAAVAIGRRFGSALGCELPQT